MTITNETLVMLIELADKKPSQYEGYYWRATWYEPITQEYFKTDITSATHNFKNWQSILHDPQPLGVYDGLKIRELNKHGHELLIENRRVICGDSKPSKLHRFTFEELENVRKNYNGFTPKNNFNQIFDSSK